MIDFQTIMIFLVVLIILFLIFRQITRPDGITGILDATIEQDITTDQMGINDDTQNYISSYTIWTFVSNWNYRYGQEKIIFKKQTDDTDPDIIVALGALTNNIQIRIKSNKTETITNNQGNSVTSPIYRICDVINIPLQSWVCIAIVINNKFLDVYMNGKLVKTCPLYDNDSTYNINNMSPVTLTPNGGFSGNTAKFNYYNYDLSPQDIWNIYKSGYKESSIFSSNYDIDLIIKKDNEIVYES
jgi:hypothetical protein